MSKKKTRVAEQCDSLLNKLQPGFRTKKKEALADFSVFFFSKRSETVGKEDVLRLFVGEGKRIGLLAICGKKSKSGGTMQRAASRAIDLVAGLMDKTKNPTDWFSFQQVFLALDPEYLKLMCLQEHETSPPVLALRNYLKNADQYRAEANEAAEKAGPPNDDMTRMSLAVDVNAGDDEKKARTKEPCSPMTHSNPRKPSATGAVTQFKRPVVSSSTDGLPNAMTAQAQADIRNKMNIRDTLNHFLAARQAGEQLIKMGVLVRGATFGVPLPDLVKLSGKDGVPNIVRNLVDFMKPEIIKMHGVFRISGEMGEIQNLKRIYDFESEKDLDLRKFEAHSITGCLKMYLRELPDPLFTYERYDAIVEAFRQGNTNLVSEIVQGLPQCNLKTWNYILEMLVLCQSYSATNMMTAKNLALVMSPNILRLRVETFAKIAQDTPITVGAVEHLITSHALKLGVQIQPKIPGMEPKESKDSDEIADRGPSSPYMPGMIKFPAPSEMTPIKLRPIPVVTTDSSPAAAALLSPRASEAVLSRRSSEGKRPAEAAAALLSPRSSEAVMARRSSEGPPPANAAVPSPNSPWRQYTDKKTGMPYYHNKDTKETVWIKPADF